MAFYRKVHLEDGNECRYHIGKTGIKFSINDKSFFKTYDKLFEEGFEGLSKTGNSSYSYAYPDNLTPGIIKRYIERTIYGVNHEPYLRCVRCNQQSKDVSSRVDPYRYEIYGDETKHVLCNECNGESMRDI